MSANDDGLREAIKAGQLDKRNEDYDEDADAFGHSEEWYIERRVRSWLASRVPSEDEIEAGKRAIVSLWSQYSHPIMREVYCSPEMRYQAEVLADAVLTAARALSAHTEDERQ